MLSISFAGTWLIEPVNFDIFLDVSVDVNGAGDGWKKKKWEESSRQRSILFISSTTELPRGSIDAIEMSGQGFTRIADDKDTTSCSPNLVRPVIFLETGEEYAWNLIWVAVTNGNGSAKAA